MTEIASFKSISIIETTEKNYRSGKLRRREFWLDMSTKLFVFVSGGEENEENINLEHLTCLVLEV